MTDYERECAYKNVKDQLEGGHIDISVTHDENEMEIVRRGMTALRICEQYKRELNKITLRIKDSGLQLDQEVKITKEEYENLLKCNMRYEELRS